MNTGYSKNVNCRAILRAFDGAGAGFESDNRHIGDCAGAPAGRNQDEDPDSGGRRGHPAIQHARRLQPVPCKVE